jgi:hypothetical protein
MPSLPFRSTHLELEMTRVILEFTGASFTEAMLRLSLMAGSSRCVVKHAGDEPLAGKMVPVVQIVPPQTVVPIRRTTAPAPQPAA